MAKMKAVVIRGYNQNGKMICHTRFVPGSGTKTSVRRIKKAMRRHGAFFFERENIYEHRDFLRRRGAQSLRLSDWRSSVLPDARLGFRDVAGFLREPRREIIPRHNHIGWDAVASA